MDAMEQSNLVLAKILNLAMQNGISHWSLEFKALELSDDYATYFYPCVSWLKEEGLVRVGSFERTLGGLAEGSIENISLTSRGMAVLGQKIVVGESERTLSETVKQVSEGKVDFHRIGDAIGGILGGFVKSFGS